MIGCDGQEPINLVHRLRCRDERAGAVLGFMKDRRRSAWGNPWRPGPCNQLVRLPRLELGGEMTGMPKVLGEAEPALLLHAMVDAPVPLAASHITGAGDPISVFEDKAVRAGIDGRGTVCEPLAVHVAPGAKRMQLETDGAGGSDDPMDDRDRGAAMIHGDLSLDRHVAYGPAPSREPVLELEALEVDVAGWVDRPRRPLVHRQRNAALADDEDGVEGGEAEHPATWRPRRDNEQAVIAPGLQAGHCPHRVAAKAIRHQPLALRRFVEVATKRPPESHCVSVKSRATTFSAGDAVFGFRCVVLCDRLYLLRGWRMVRFAQAVQGWQAVSWAPCRRQPGRA